MAPGTYYFRLRQVDINGDFEYFEMKKVSIGEIESILRIFPVPASQGQEVTLEGVQSGETLLQIISLQGQVLAREIKKVESSGVLKISTTNMLPGTYIIKVGNEATRLIVR